MLDTLQAPSNEDVLNRGYLELHQNFNEYGSSPQEESYANYSINMYNSKTIPCPAGNEILQNIMACVGYSTYIAIGHPLTWPGKLAKVRHCPSMLS